MIDNVAEFIKNSVAIITWLFVINIFTNLPKKK